MMTGRRVALTLLLLSAVLSAALQAPPAAAQRLAGEMKAEVVRQAALPERLHVRLDRDVAGADTVRAIFHDVLDRRGYRIDETSEFELLVRWDGQLDEDGFESRFRPEGRVGSNSAASLGLSIMLASPNAQDGEETYTVGCQLSDGTGHVWKAKIVAVSADTNRTRIVRYLAERLIDAMGQEVAPAPFDTSSPD